MSCATLNSIGSLPTTGEVHPLVALPRLRDLLLLFGSLRDLSQPLTTPAGLRQALGAVLQFARLAGLDTAIAARLQSLLQNDQLIDLLLAAVKFAGSTSPAT